MAKHNLDYATEDLFNSISKGDFPSWNFYVQIIPEKDGEKYKYDIYDVTKVVLKSDYPLIPVGVFTLNRNPENYFAEVEQAAFAPTNLVPGIEPSNDKMLQGRLFSYPDTHRHRLGANFDQIPINCPYRARISNYHRDGPAQVKDNFGPLPNYEPNSLNGPVEDKSKSQALFAVHGQAGKFKHTHPNDDFEQPRLLFKKVMTESDRQHLIENIAGGLGKCRRDIQERMVKLFFKIDPEYGSRVAKAINFPTQEIAKL